MGYLSKIAGSVILASALVLGSGGVASARDSFPLALGRSYYEAKMNKEKGIEAPIGELEKNVAGFIEMEVEKERNEYVVKLSARSRPGFLKFSHESEYRLAKSSENGKNLYRSLENFLENTFQVIFLPLNKTTEYIFGAFDDKAEVKIKSADEVKKFSVSEDVAGPFALLGNFFSEDCYEVGRRCIGKMKGNNDAKEEDVYADVIRSGDGYMVEIIVPKDVFWEKNLPIRFYYKERGEGVDIFRMEVFAAKTFGALDRWIVATPAEKMEEGGMLEDLTEKGR